MTIIILAAGLSKRMGDDINKLLLPYKGKTILDSIISTSLSTNYNVIVVLGYDSVNVKKVVEKYPVKIVENKDYEKGQMESTLKGIECIEDGENFAIVPADLPLIKPEIFKRGETFLKFSTIIRPKHANTFGHPVFFSSKLKEKILREKSRSMKEFCEKEGFLTLEEDMSCTFDIDTLEKYNNLIKVH